MPRNVDVWLEFSRGMNPVTLESAITVSASERALIDFHLLGEWEDWTLQFPVDLPASTLITVNIDTSAEDQYGQPLDQVYEFSFTTGVIVDNTPPQLVSTTPANGASVPVTTGLMQFTFDEAIDDYSLNPTVVSGQFAMNMWVMDVDPQWNDDRTVITVDLTTPLAAGTTFMIQFDSFADISGNVNTDGFTYQFTVDGDPDYYPVVHGQWSVFMGYEESNDPDKYTGETQMVEQIEVTGGAGEFLIKEWDPWSEAFNNWDLMTINSGGVLFRGFHETDWDSQESFDIMFNPVIQWMRFPVTAQNWNGTAMFDSSEPGGADRVVYSVEQVTGTFDVLVETPDNDPSLFTKESGPGSDILWMGCRKSVLHYELTDGFTTFNTGTDTLYYAPGVGLVREESLEEETGGFTRTSELNLMWLGDHLPFYQ